MREIGSTDVKATKLAQEPVKWHAVVCTEM